MTRSKQGRRNEAVLPLPVTAEAQTSKPLRLGGMLEDWMGVGVMKPMEVQPRRRGRERFRVEKEVVVEVVVIWEE